MPWRRRYSRKRLRKGYKVMKVFDSKSMQKLDKAAIRKCGIKGIVLMENAGSGVARIIRGMLAATSEPRVVVIVGKGSNGGDGYVIARHLVNSGISAVVLSIGGTGSLRGDAAVNAEAWRKMGGETITLGSKRSIEGVSSLLKHSSLVVDALFGTGLTSEIKAPLRLLVEIVNTFKSPVVSVDIPSGIDATSGKVLGCAIKATVTATMAAPKPGLYLYPGRDYSGRVEVVDIGMPRSLIEDAPSLLSLATKDAVSRVLTNRQKDTHKGSYGHVLILGGSIGKSGAVAMAVDAALRSGAGLVTAAVPESINDIIELKCTEAMSVPLPDKDGVLLEDSLKEAVRAIEGKSALVVGPGLGPAGRDFVEGVVKCAAEAKIPIVIDADGLNAFGKELSSLKKISGGGAGTVITPHPAEASRLLGVSTSRVQDDRVGSVVGLAKAGNTVTVLKGASSIVSDGKRVSINPTGNPGMATAGSGDVLCGILGAFVGLGAEPFDAAVGAVYLHGLCGDIVAGVKGEHSLVATDLIGGLPGAVSSLR